MSKEKEQLKNKINQYLDVYSLDQLQFLKHLKEQPEKVVLFDNSLYSLCRKIK